MNHAVLTDPTHLHTVQLGQVTFSARRTVDGGYTFHVWNGPSRHNATSWTYSDARLAAARYNVIAQMSATGATAAQIADTLNSDAAHALSQVADLLRDAHERADATDCHSLARDLNQLVAEVETDAERARLDALAARINTTINQAHGQCHADQHDDQPAPVRTLADLRAQFAATHPQPADSKPRRSTRRSPAAAYDKSRARTEANR